MWSLCNKNITIHFHQEKWWNLLLHFSHYLYIHQWWSCSNNFCKCLWSSLFQRSEHTFEHTSGGKKSINSKNVCLRSVSSAHDNEEELFIQHNKKERFTAGHIKAHPAHRGFSDDRAGTGAEESLHAGCVFKPASHLCTLRNVSFSASWTWHSCRGCIVMFNSL